MGYKINLANNIRSAACLLEESFLFAITRNPWMDGLQFYVLLNSVSVISGRWTDGYERLCAMESRLRLKRSPPQAGIEPGTAR